MKKAITGGVTSKSQQILRRLRDSADPKSARMRNLINEMEKSVKMLEAQAKDGWPVERNTKGNPTRKRQGEKHSVDMFETRLTLTGTSIIATVYNTASYAYYIKSVMTGESVAEQRERNTWRDGVSQDRFEAQRRIGSKKSAYTKQLRSPGKKMGRKLAKQLQSDLVAALRGAL